MNHQQYLERHYDRLALRLSINDGLAKRLEFTGLPLPAIAVYQSSFGRDTLMPMTRLLVEARQGLRCLALVSSKKTGSQSSKAPVHSQNQLDQSISQRDD